MPLFDLPREQLLTYRSSTEPPAELMQFWADTLAEARGQSSELKVEPVETGLRLVQTYDVTFSGFGGDPIRGWHHRPAGVDADLPIIVRYQGYGGGRGLAHQVGQWPLAGYACLEVDTRGQGSGYLPGNTPDPVGAGPAYPGYMTRGILDPQEYYYRRVLTDAVLAVDAAKSLPAVDPSRIAITGNSQGGAMSLAVASLRDDLAAVMSDVPFLCDFRRATEITNKGPYTEIANYLKVHRNHIERVFATLAYFDVTVLVRAARAPALFSVALMDETCPPSTVYAAFNAYGGPKQIIEYAYNDHEGGQGFQDAEQLRWLAAGTPT